MTNFGVLDDECEGEPEDFEHVQYPEIEEQIGGLPVKRDPFDPAPLVQLFDRYRVEIRSMMHKVGLLVVKDDSGAETASLYTTQAKKLASVIEKKRQELKAPYLSVTSVLDSETKSLKDELSAIQTTVNKLLSPYLQEKERQRREAELTAREAVGKLQRELEEKARIEREKAAEEARKAAEAAGMDKEKAEVEAQAAAAMVEAPPVVVAEAVPDETKMKTDSGSVDLKTEWVWTVTDFRKIPDAAFEARREHVEKAIGPWITAQVRAGVRNIPGIKIYQEAKVKTRLR